MSRNVANGEAIRRIRELAGFSQMAFAEEMGVSRQALCLVEAGGGMRPKNLKAAAKVLRVPVTSLTVPAYTAAEVCVALHISRSELDKLTQRGELTTISGHITEASVEEYISRRLPERLAVTS